MRGNSLKIKEKKASLSQIKEFLQFFNDATIAKGVEIGYNFIDAKLIRIRA